MNVDASLPGASLRVQLLDPEGKPLKGFGLRDCHPIVGDVLDAPVRWQRPLSMLKGKPVRMEFVLDRCSLYGLGVMQ